MNFTAIAKAMVKPSSRVNNAMDQGYTYFGQFIAHDVLETTNPACRSRTVAPQLNLDSLYDDFDMGTRWKTLFNADASFITEGFELKRDQSAEKKALIPEQRNDENVIIAQFHRLWQDVHNKILETTQPTGNLEAKVRETRKLAILTFQLLTIIDFSKLLLTRDVYHQYFVQNNTYLLPGVSAIPAEFSHAAFRFGHSIVRSDYTLDPNKEGIALENLLQGNRHSRQISGDMEIDWTLFFSGKRIAEKAFFIDPIITDVMGELPDCEDPNAHLNIALANLRAGANLPSGYDLTQKILQQTNAATIVSELGLTPLTNLGKVLSNISSVTIKNLPLWPYILLEAEQKGGSKTLGPLGSMICAESLRWMIESNPVSVYKNGIFDAMNVKQMMGVWGDTLFGQDDSVSMAELINIL